MGCPKRAIVVFLSFLGFLILFGFRTVFTMVMVYVIKDNDNDGVTFFKEVTNNQMHNKRHSVRPTIGLERGYVTVLQHGLLCGLCHHTVTRGIPSRQVLSYKIIWGCNFD